MTGRRKGNACPKRYATFLALPAVVAALVSLAACVDPLVATLEEAALAENTPGGSSVPANGSQIAPADRIRIRFSESMLEDSAELETTPSDLSYTLSWETTLEESDTLVLAPVTAWPLYEEVTLAVTASSSRGFTSRRVETTFNVVGAEIYVSVNQGDDDAPGSPAAPLRTIGEALERAQARRDGGFAELQTVRVAAGRYEESVELVTDVRLFGGYDEAFATRSLGSSVIAGAEEPDFSVYIPTWDEGLFDAVFDGFTVEEPPGNKAASAQFGGNVGRVVARNVTIHGETVPAVNAFGALTVILEDAVIRGPAAASTAIYADGPELILRNSEVSMGEVLGAQSFRVPTVWIESAVASLEGSSILGPTGEIGESVAVLFNDGVLSVENSVINGGSGAQVRGVRSSSGDVTVRNSTLRVGPATGSAPDAAAAVEGRFYLEDESTGDLTQLGVEGIEGNGLTVENSIVFGVGDANSAGIVHGDLPIIRNNIFHNLQASSLYRDAFGNPQSFTAAALNAEQNILIGAADNSELDPLLAAAVSLQEATADWRLTAGSPAKAREGGYDLSEAGVAPLDVAGTSRTAPWSIGAYEYD